MKGLAPITPKGALKAVDTYCIQIIHLLENLTPSDFNLGKKEALVELSKALPILMERAKVKPNEGMRSHCKALSENI